MSQLTYDPVANGNLTQLVPLSGTNWGTVADYNDSTYVLVGENVGYRYDLYQISATLRGARDKIGGVTIYTRCDTTAADNYGNKSKAVIFTHGTLYAGSERSLFWHNWYDHVWLDFYDTWPVNPYTGAEWTWDEIVALQIGVGLINDYHGYTRCAKVASTVDFTTRRIVGRSQIIGGW